VARFAPEKQMKDTAAHLAFLYTEKGEEASVRSTVAFALRELARDASTSLKVPFSE
jgi:hypothetical protein